jgi:hypothetical protein
MHKRPKVLKDPMRCPFVQWFWQQKKGFIRVEFRSAGCRIALFEHTGYAHKQTADAPAVVFLYGRTRRRS